MAARGRQCSRMVKRKISNQTSAMTSCFLSCDWGTTAFRLRLVDRSTLKIIAEEKKEQGIAKTFEEWKQQEQFKNKRWEFYLNILKNQLNSIEQKSGVGLNGIPVVISGMASSNIGMIELPYKELPFLLDGSDLQTKVIKASGEFSHDLLIISGTKTENDVMRGEETKLIGVAGEYYKNENLFIFPGTHTKHLISKDGKARTFNTFMTGEFFALLSEKSILSDSVLKTGQVNEMYLKSFQKGIRDVANLNLLNACFHVRTNHLFRKVSKEENYYYLSGLLVGNELNELGSQHMKNIILVSSTPLEEFYRIALETRFGSGVSIDYKDTDKALIHGQLNLMNKLL